MKSNLIVTRAPEGVKLIWSEPTLNTLVLPLDTARRVAEAITAIVRTAEAASDIGKAAMAVAGAR